MFGAEMAVSFQSSEEGPKAENSRQFWTAQAGFGGCLLVVLFALFMMIWTVSSRTVRFCLLAHVSQFVLLLTRNNMLLCVNFC